MPKTIIRIKTWRCAYCGFVWNDRGGECPKCGSSLEKETRERWKTVVTTIGEEEVDEMIMHGDDMIKEVGADQRDASEIEQASGEGRQSEIKPRRQPTQEEKQALKQKIKDNIKRARELEDK